MIFPTGCRRRQPLQMATAIPDQSRNNTPPARVILSVAETQSGGEVELRSSAERSDGGTSGGKSMRLSNTSSVTHSRATFLPEEGFLLHSPLHPTRRAGACSRRDPRPIKEQRANGNIAHSPSVTHSRATFLPEEGFSLHSHRTGGASPSPTAKRREQIAPTAKAPTRKTHKFQNFRKPGRGDLWSPAIHDHQRNRAQTKPPSRRKALKKRNAKGK